MPGVPKNEIKKALQEQLNNLELDPKLKNIEGYQEWCKNQKQLFIDETLDNILPMCSKMGIQGKNFSQDKIDQFASYTALLVHKGFLDAKKKTRKEAHSIKHSLAMKHREPRQQVQKQFSKIKNKLKKGLELLKEGKDIPEVSRKFKTKKTTIKKKSALAKSTKQTGKAYKPVGLGYFMDKYRFKSKDRPNSKTWRSR